MSEGSDPNYPPPAAFSERAHIGSIEQYKEEYQRSIEDPESFWPRRRSASIGSKDGTMYANGTLRHLQSAGLKAES